MPDERRGQPPSDSLDDGMVPEAIVSLLRRIPERWAEFDHDMLSETEAKALFLLVAAGMVERRIRFRTRMHNHPVAVEGDFTATGEYGTIEALRRVSAAMWREWQDTWVAWRASETSTECPLFFERLKPDEWRLTRDGALAHDDLHGSGAAVVVDFVLRRGFFDGQPRLVDGEWKRREPVRGTGTLLSMRKVPADAIPTVGVNIQNWAEGATAFAKAFQEVAAQAEVPHQGPMGRETVSESPGSSRGSREPTVKESPRSQTRRGRKSASDPKADKRIWEAWSSGEHNTYADVEQALNLARGEAKRAIDRHRKRAKPPK